MCFCTQTFFFTFRFSQLVLHIFPYYMIVELTLQQTPYIEPQINTNHNTKEKRPTLFFIFVLGESPKEDTPLFLSQKGAHLKNKKNEETKQSHQEEDHYFWL